MNGRTWIDRHPLVQHALAVDRLPRQHGAGEIGHVQNTGHLLFAIDFNLGLQRQVILPFAGGLRFFVIQDALHRFSTVFLGDRIGVDVKQTLVVGHDGLPLGLGIGQGARNKRPS